MIRMHSSWRLFDGRKIRHPVLRVILALVGVALLGVLLARAGSKGGHWEIALAGLAQTVVGSAVLIWAGFNYRRLHGPIEQGGDGVVHPGAARTVGWITIVFTAVSLAVAIDMILT